MSNAWTRRAKAQDKLTGSRSHQQRKIGWGIGIVYLERQYCEFVIDLGRSS